MWLFSKAENTIIIMRIVAVNLFLQKHKHTGVSRYLFQHIYLNSFWLCDCTPRYIYFFLWLGEWDVYWFCFAPSFVEIYNAFYSTAPTVIFFDIQSVNTHI